MLRRITSDGGKWWQDGGAGRWLARPFLWTIAARFLQPDRGTARHPARGFSIVAEGYRDDEARHPGQAQATCRLELWDPGLERKAVQRLLSL